MHGEVLWRRYRTVVDGITALHPSNKRDRQSGTEERVLTVGLLSTAPARIAEDVHVGRPEVKALEDARMAVMQSLGVLDTPFDADRRGHFPDSRDIERGRKPDGLRKFRGALAEDSVQGFAPPIVGRHAEARDGPGLIHELRGLLLQRHAVYQVSRSLLRGQTGVHERQRADFLRASAGQEEETRKNRDDPDSAPTEPVSCRRTDGPHCDPVTGYS